MIRVFGDLDSRDDGDINENLRANASYSEV